MCVCVCVFVSILYLYTHGQEGCHGGSELFLCAPAGLAEAGSTGLLHVAGWGPRRCHLLGALRVKPPRLQAPLSSARLAALPQPEFMAADLHQVWM